MKVFRLLYPNYSNPLLRKGPISVLPSWPVIIFRMDITILCTSEISVNSVFFHDRFYYGPMRIILYLGGGGDRTYEEVVLELRLQF